MPAAFTTFMAFGIIAIDPMETTVAAVDSVENVDHRSIFWARGGARRLKFGMKGDMATRKPMARPEAVRAGPNVDRAGPD